MVVILIFPIASDITAPLPPSLPSPTQQQIHPSTSQQSLRPPQKPNTSNDCDQRKSYYYGGTEHTNAVHCSSRKSESPNLRSCNVIHARKPQNVATTEAQKSKATAKPNNIRHVTRVNISDVYSQIDVDGNVEPVTKEGKKIIAKINLLSLYFMFHFH